MKYFPYIVLFLCLGCTQEGEKNNTSNPKNFWGTDLEDILFEKAPALDKLSYAINLEDLRNENDETYTLQELAFYGEIPFTGVAYIINHKGLILNLYTFKDGQLFGACRSYNENGLISYKTSYFNNEEVGPFQSFLERTSNNVYLFQEGFHENGKWEGLLLEYYENGEIHTKSYYHDDALIGHAVEYDTLGNIVKITSNKLIHDGFSEGTTIYQTFESASHDGSIPDYVLKSKIK